MATRMRKASQSPSKGQSIRYSSPTPNKSFQAESNQYAYSDPSDLTDRTILKNVTFDRRDFDNLSRQATTLFNSTTIFSDESERSWLLANVHSTTISVNVDNVSYTINANYILNENQPFVLVLHGFGPGGNWANWIKLAQPLSLQGSYSVIFADLPGFGCSSGRDLNQASWKRHAPEIVVGILCSFKIRSPVRAVAQCGGAGTIVRTLNRYPLWFRGRGIVLSNSVIGDFNESTKGEFETNLTRYNIYIVVYWIADRDHPKHCVAFKRWNKLQQSGFRYLRLIDLDPLKQTMKKYYPTVKISKIGRCSAQNEAYVYMLSDEFIQQVLDTLSHK